MSSKEGSFSSRGSSASLTDAAFSPLGFGETLSDVDYVLLHDEGRLAARATSGFEKKLGTLLDTIEEFNERAEEKSHISRRLGQADKERIENALEALKQEIRNPSEDTTTIDVVVGRRELREIRKEYEDLLKAQNKILELIAYGAECSVVALRQKKDDASKAIDHLNDQFKTAVRYIITGNDGREKDGIGDLITKYKNGEPINHGKFVEALRHAVVSLTKLAHAFVDKLQHIVKQAGLKISEKVSEGLGVFADIRADLAKYRAKNLGVKMGELVEKISIREETKERFDVLKDVAVQLRSGAGSSKNISELVTHIAKVSSDSSDQQEKKLKSLKKELASIQRDIKDLESEHTRLQKVGGSHRADAETTRDKATKAEERREATKSVQKPGKPSAYDTFETDEDRPTRGRGPGR